MKLVLYQIGKTRQNEVEALFNFYQKRIGKYLDLESVVLKEPKNTRSLPESEWKEKEGAVFLEALESRDYVILLDESGEQPGSRKFAQKLQQIMNGGPKQIVFLIGGPYGFSPSVYQRADYKLSLSRMTFPHDLIRVIFAEQIYRAFSILHNEPYHHD